jgi:hypothetical protein
MQPAYNLRQKQQKAKNSGGRPSAKAPAAGDADNRRPAGQGLALGIGFPQVEPPAQ